MRILLHDFGAYGFIVQLAQWLAAHGHMVLHLRSGDLVGPQGIVESRPDDPPGLRFETLSVGRPFARYAPHRRLPDEIRYGRRLGRVIADWRPDIVLSANTPPFAQSLACRAARRQGVPFINWVQDIFTEGAGPLTARLPWPLGHLALSLLRRTEYGAMRRSSAVIVISDGFRDRLRQNAVDHPLILVQENWSPPQHDFAEDARAAGASWAAAQGLAGRRLLLAAGTLGMKHDPSLLADLALALADDPSIRVVVVSQGPGREHLEQWRRGHDAPLVLMDYQPAADVPAMLASAEIGLVLLTSAAGGMSVPSKVYTYAAAGLPILAAIPADNHVAGLIRDHKLGLVVAPDDRAGFVAAARRLLTDGMLREACAAAGRAFSARHGDMDGIGRRLERLLLQTIDAAPPAPRRYAGLPAGTEGDLLCSLASGPTGGAHLAGSRILDTDRLSSLAQAHGLVPLLAKAGKAWEPSISQALRATHKAQTLRLMALCAMLVEVTGALEEKAIRVLALKGPALSILLHGDPYLRPCGDIDLLVDPRDAVAAAQLLEELGFAPALATPVAALVATNKDAPYRRNNLMVELHWRLFDNPLLLTWRFDDLWAERVTVPFGRQAVPTLSVRHYGVYLAVHGLRHGWQRLRWLVDLALLTADAGRARAILDQAATDRMLPALEQGMLLARDVLAVPVPPVSGRIRTRLLSAATDRLTSILHHPDPGPGLRVQRRLMERLISLILAPSPRAAGLEIQAMIRGPGEMEAAPLRGPFIWMRPFQRQFLRIVRLLRGGGKTQAGSARTNR